MEEKLKTVDLQKPFLPVLHNVDVQIHEEPDAIRDVLAAQVASPVLWADTVRKMEEAGVMEFMKSVPEQLCPEWSSASPKELLLKH